MHGTIASSGLAAFQQAYNRFEAVMGSMASGDLDSLPEDLVELSIARTQFSAAGFAMRVADDSARSLLDIFA